MAKYDETIIHTMFTMRYVDKQTISSISDDLGIPRSSVFSILTNNKHRYKYKDEFVYDENDADEEVVESNVKLAKKVQRLQDSNRISNKSFREFARADNMILELNEKMTELLESKEFHTNTKLHETISGEPVGVIQLSDLHFNELITDLSGNNFDMSVASKRLEKHVTRCINYFLSVGVSNVGLFLTGDLLNSDRRISEITEAATNRTNALFVAVDVLQQVITHLNTHFNVTVASVTGNESRVKEFIDYTNFLASDSYDIAIHQMLTWLFRGSEGVRFIAVENPLECVVDVNGTNFLLVHGHAHKGLARTSNIENEVERIKSRYGARGVLVDFVICGHVHQAYVSDLFARSGGLPGANSYSERALNYNSRSSQNAYVVWENRSVDGMKIDLQDVTGFEGYEFDLDMQSYNNDSGQGGTVVIQSVLV